MTVYVALNDTKDMAIWSTSGLNLAHMGEDFSSEGTLEAPKV